MKHKLLKAACIFSAALYFCLGLAACSPGTASDGGTGSHVHEMTEHKKVEPTCTGDGQVQYWSCSVCGSNFADKEGKKELDGLTIPALGHDIQRVEAREATCSECGYPEHDACVRCGYTPEKIEYTDALHIKYDLITKGSLYQTSAGNAYRVTRCSDCTDTEIVIPDFYKGLPVTAIFSNAFSDCSELESIKIPDTMIRIESNTFYRCNKLERISIGNGVTKMGHNAFAGTKYYEDPANWDENGILYIDNYLIEAQKTISGIYSVRANTITIAEGAFYQCDKLTSVKFPDSLTTIGDSAFRYCTGMENITIGEGITSIGTRTFYSCESLKRVEFSDSVTSIGKEAFYECIGLTNIDFPKHLSSIGYGAFYECSGLTGTLVIPDSVTSIGDDAFEFCGGIEHITIGKRVEYIGYGAFNACHGLKGHLELPDSVDEIGRDAFSGNQFESVRIGKGVKSIGYDAFNISNEDMAIYFFGTAVDWSGIEKEDEFPAENLYYFSRETPTAEQWAEWGRWWHYDPSTQLPVSWQKA